MSKIKVSIVVPIYNLEDYVPRCLDALVNQTLQEIEIICINDNSSDKTSAILEKLKKEDPRITILKNKLQRGVLYNYIDGSMQAKGEYVAFLNVNDYFTSKDILNNVYEIATKKFEEKIDIVHYQICGSIYDKENKNIESLNHYHTVNLNNINKIMKKPYIEENYFQKNRDITESRFAFDKIYKKELIQKIADYIGPQIWNQKLSYAYEFLFAFSSMKQCDTFVTINDIGYCHKIKDESKMWEIDDNRLKYNESGNKDIGDYMLVLERIIQLTEKDKECGEFRENILKELTTEHYLKAIARSIFYDKFLTLYEKIYNWKFGDKETKKRAKENIKNIISYKIESKKKFANLLGV